jgi:hypothetical protein
METCGIAVHGDRTVFHHDRAFHHNRTVFHHDRTVVHGDARRTADGMVHGHHRGTGSGTPRS